MKIRLSIIDGYKVETKRESTNRIRLFLVILRVVFDPGVTPGSHSYLERYKNVFVSCCGRSFYKQCLPDASM